MNNLTIQTQMNRLSGFGQINQRPELPTLDKPGAIGGAGDPVKGASFKDVLAESIGKVNDHMIKADEKINAVVSGESEDIHGTLIQMQKADVSFRMLLQVRKKMLDTYQEVMRMQA